MDKILTIYKQNIELEHTCVGISIYKHEKLMKGAKKANGKKIRQMIKKQLPDLYRDLSLDFYNPYENQSKRTDTHLIYIHSSIEYFLKII